MVHMKERGNTIVDMAQGAIARLMVRSSWRSGPKELWCAPLERGQADLQRWS